MFNLNKFKIALLNAGKTQEDVANLLGINVSTLYRKTKGQSDFYRNEIQLIATFLNLEDEAVHSIFFDN